MPANGTAFSQWALDDARTADERYLIYLVCEACRLLERLRQPLEWQRQHLYEHVPQHKWKEYYLNPLLMPQYDFCDTERTAAMAPFFTQFAPDTNFERRRIGDAGAVLRFFPALEVVSLGSCAISDVSFVEALPRLRSLLLHSGVLEDLVPLAGCAALRELSLGFAAPGAPLFTPPLHWLDARPLGALRQLEKLSLHPNPAILAGLSFPALTSAVFGGSSCVQPDCAHLPDMPALRLLTHGGMQSLRGISRFPELRHLKISGPLRDWGDLGALKHLDCLEVDAQDGWPRDVAPLCQVPELLWARFGGEIPRNYWPLAQSPRLCELLVHPAPTVQLDVQAINAALRPWDEVFALPRPRPVPPLRFVAVEHGGDRSVLPRHADQPGPDYRQHPKLFHLENCWMDRRAHAAANEAAGRDITVQRRNDHPSETNWERTVSIHIESLEALQRFPAVIEALRSKAMAWSSRDWRFKIYVNLRITRLELTPQQRQWIKEIEDNSTAWEDEQESKRWRMTKDHIIETQFRLRTNAEDGEEPDPQDFEPPEEIRPEDYRRRARTPSAGPAKEDDNEEERPDFELKPYDEQEQNTGGSDDHDDDSTVSTAPPPQPPENFFEDPYAHPLADSYRFWATLTFDTFYHEGHNYATVRQLMGRDADEYHAAPPKPE